MIRLIFPWRVWLRKNLWFSANPCYHLNAFNHYLIGLSILLEVRLDFNLPLPKKL